MVELATAASASNDRLLRCPIESAKAPIDDRKTFELPL